MIDKEKIYRKNLMIILRPIITCMRVCFFPPFNVEGGVPGARVTITASWFCFSTIGSEKTAVPRKLIGARDPSSIENYIRVIVFVPGLSRVYFHSKTELLRNSTTSKIVLQTHK
jgi:hypothetical protein